MNQIINHKKEIYILYRHILKAHSKYLKEDMRVFGDFFVKTEFHLNYSNADENQSILFINQWKEYYNCLVSNSIKVDDALNNKMDLDHMKTMKDIENVIKK